MMSDVYFTLRPNPLDPDTEWSAVQITSSDDAVTPCGTWLGDGQFVTVCVEGSTIKSYLSDDLGQTWSYMASLVSNAGSSFIVRDSDSGLIFLVWWDETTAKILFNISSNNLAGGLVYSTSKTVYDTAVDQQQASIVIVGSGQLLVTLVNESGVKQSFYSDDLGATWGPA